MRRGNEKNYSRVDSHREKLVLNCHFPLKVHQKIKKYVSINLIFILSFNEKFLFQNCVHLKTIIFCFSTSEKSQIILTDIKIFHAVMD